MTTFGTSQLYDVEKALRELAIARRRPDPTTRAQLSVADDMVNALLAEIPADEHEHAGRLLILLSGMLADLVVLELPSAVLANVPAFAGQRLMVDARAAAEAEEAAVAAAREPGDLDEQMSAADPRAAGGSS